MPRGLKKANKTEKTIKRSSNEVDFKTEPMSIGVGDIAIFLNGINRPKTLIGKVTKVFDRGIEVYAEAWYVAEWKNIIRIYTPKEAKYAYDTKAAIDELAKEDADAKRAKSDMNSRRSDEDEGFVIAKPEPEVQDDLPEEVEDEPVAKVEMRRVRSKSITVLGKTFASKNDAYKWLRDEKKMSWKEVIATCKGE